jgi:hypothetical protein
MEKDLTKQLLEEMVEVEKGTRLDMFDKISILVNKYKEVYGEDEWINDFTFEYLADRRAKRKI